eukprot:g8279.t1
MENVTLTEEENEPYQHEYDFYLEYLKEKEENDKRKAKYTRHCCTCDKAEGTDWVKMRKSRLRKDFTFVRNMKVKLLPKPRPYVLDIVNSYTYVCRTCNKINDQEVELEHQLVKNMHDIFNCVKEGIDGKIIILHKYLGQEGLDYRQPVTLLAPLHLCSIKHSLYCAQELIAHGASLEVLDREEKTPLWYACSVPDRHDMVHLLLESGANPNATNAKTSTCLMAAVIAGEVEYVSMLIKHGVNVNATMDDGTSAIFKAAKLGMPFILRELLLAKGNPTLCNDKAISPLDVAIKRRNLEPRFEICVQLLNCTKIQDIAKVILPGEEYEEEIDEYEQNYEDEMNLYTNNTSNDDDIAANNNVDEYGIIEVNNDADEKDNNNLSYHDYYYDDDEGKTSNTYPWEYCYDNNGYGGWYNHETGLYDDGNTNYYNNEGDESSINYYSYEDENYESYNNDEGEEEDNGQNNKK